MKKLFTLFAVAAMAFAGQANELTVCDNGGYDGYSNNVPMYGFWADTEGTLSQMIYPATKLTDMIGSEITEMKFYTLAQYYVENGMDPYINETNFINFENAKIQLSFKVVDQNDFSQVVVGATPVATTVPEKGDMYMTFKLDEPYTYEGGNLLVEAKVIEGGTFGTTYFYGVISGTDLEVPEDCSIYSYQSAYSGTSTYLVDFLPMATFTYEAAQVPVVPTEACAKPEGGYVNGIDFHGVLVTLINNETAEGTELHYTVTLNGEVIIEDAIYDDAFALTQDGDYVIDFWATAPGKLDSTHGGLIFTIDAFTGLSEMNADKAVAGVRYFNMAGQEMQQAEGLTIVVTTYTDGTTSAVKVVK